METGERTRADPYRKQGSYPDPKPERTCEFHIAGTHQFQKVENQEKTKGDNGADQCSFPGQIKWLLAECN